LKLRQLPLARRDLPRNLRASTQWKPVLKTSFPLESSVIAAQIFPRIKLDAPQLSKLRHEKDEFL
jgi:hypothetical protein